MSGGTKWKGPPLILRLERDGQILHEARADELAFPLLVGRSAMCAWMTPADDLSVSGRHAEVCVRRRTLWVRDVGSRNGLFVTGARVKEVRLKEGVRVSLGRCLLCVEKGTRDSGAAAHRHHRLEALTGDDAGRTHDLTQPVVVIGSDAPTDAGVRCASLLVSRRHAEITQKPDGSCWIRDLGSRNGTQVNRLPLKGTERMLRHGDVISCADVEFRFWDRNGPPPNPWKMKLFIALVTAALCGTGYFLVESLFPSAKTLLAQASALEWHEQFGAAGAVLGQADTARGAENYREEIARLRANLAIWESTTGLWHQVQAACPARQWITASKNLGSLLADSPDRWGWNTTTAQTEKRRAAVTRQLIDVFLGARTALEGTSAGAGQEGVRALLERHLAAMRAALARADWTDDIPVGDLRADMTEQCEAMRAVIDDLKTLEALVARLPRPASDGLKDVMDATGDLAARAGRLERLKAAAEARDDRRAKAAQAVGRKFVKTTLVTDRCERYRPVLEKLADTRRVLAANCAALARLDPGALQTDLPLPSERQGAEFTFGEIARAFTAANERLCGAHRANVRGMAERLARLRVGAGGVPPPMAPLLESAVIGRAFVCDTLDPSRPPPAASREARVGDYDRILGVEEFGPYLGDWLAPEASQTDLPLPLLWQTTALCRQCDTFRRFADDADIAYLAALDAPGNRLRALCAAALDVLEKRSLLVDAWWNTDGDARTRLVARAAAWALNDGGGALDGEDKEALEADYRAWRDGLNDLNRRLRADPTNVEDLRARIFTLGIPGNGAGGLSGHWANAAKKAAGGVR